VDLRITILKGIGCLLMSGEDSNEFTASFSQWEVSCAYRVSSDFKNCFAFRVCLSLLIASLNQSYVNRYRFCFQENFQTDDKLQNQFISCSGVFAEM